MKNSQGVFTIRHSRHSDIRRQQRAIPNEAVRWAMKLGFVFHAGYGDTAYWLSRRAVESARPEARRFAGIAVIIARDGIVRTVMHCDHPPRHWKRAA